jgi:amino acid adenylation domain-containing protein
MWGQYPSVIDRYKIGQHTELAMATSTEPLSTLPAGFDRKERTHDRRRACVADLILQAAEAAPHSAALCWRADSVSYSELVRRAARLAAHLGQHGVGPEVPVGLYLERSFDFVISALAVLLAGGAYVPLDPAWPPARLRSVLADAELPVLITRGAAAERVAGLVPVTIELDRASGAMADPEPPSGRIGIQRENLACILYTFAANGETKGVELTQANLLSLIFWRRNTFSVTARDRAGHLAGVADDASIGEIWPTLTAGAALVLADEQALSSADFLHEWLVNERITLAVAPTTLAERLLGHAWPTGTALRYLLTRGEPLQRAPAPGLPFTVVNNYGAAECTVAATSGVVAAGTLEAPAPQGPPSIGKPIANTRIRILDSDGRPVAPGQVGEIYISGASVARGYRKRPEMTAESFPRDPFSVKPGVRMYRTGDLGCLLPDGQIAWCGRTGHEMR